MDCEEFDRELQDREDSHPSPRMEAHCQVCVTCAEVLEDFNDIRTQARQLLPLEQPSERVWQGIRRQLQQDGLLKEPSRRPILQRAAGFGWFPRLRMGLAYAAVFLMGLGGVYLLSIRSAVPVPETPVAEAQTPSANVAAAAENAPDLAKPPASAEHGPAGPDEPFWQLVEKVPPEARATYVSNFQQLNSSIQQLNTFLGTHPQDRFARELLSDTYQQWGLLWETMDRQSWEEF